jgi:hypothetical protein
MLTGPKKKAFHNSCFRKHNIKISDRAQTTDLKFQNTHTLEGILTGPHVTTHNNISCLLHCPPSTDSFYVNCSGGWPGFLTRAQTGLAGFDNVVTGSVS